MALPGLPQPYLILTFGTCWDTESSRGYTHTLAKGKAVIRVSLAPYAYLCVSRFSNEREYIFSQLASYDTVGLTG